MAGILAGLGSFLWDDAGRSAALRRAAEAARDSGALQSLDTLLWVMALSELWGGTVRQAVAYDELVREVRHAMGYDAENVVNVAVLAWRGGSRELVHTIAEGANATGFGGVGASGVAALAVRDLAEGSYQDAYERFGPLVADPFLQATPNQYPDYVEAAARSGHPEVAARFAGKLAALADVNGSSWCRGVAERALALAAPDAEAEPHHTASIAALRRTGAEMDLGRAHLVYGEWLRRVRRRRAAGEQLQLALQHLRHSGADLFVPRAQAELEATGVREGADAPRREFDLTAQEHTVARLAAAGRTNSEIAAHLFLSPSTVDYHLRKIFQKLGVSSRRQLSDRIALGADGTGPTTR